MSMKEMNDGLKEKGADYYLAVSIVNKLFVFTNGKISKKELISIVEKEIGKNKD